MITVPANIQAQLDSETPTLTTVWEAVLENATVYGFTSFSRDIEIDGVTYEAETGYTPSQLQGSSDLSVTNMEASSMLDSSSIDVEDLRAGLWDYASVRLLYVDYTDPEGGTVTLLKGRLGEVKTGKVAFTAELRGLSDYLSQTIGRPMGPDCDAIYGDDRCGVRLAPPTWTANTPVTVRPDREAAQGSIVRPTVYNGRFFECSTAGTTGANQPVWNTTLGAVTADGTANWTTRAALTVQGAVTATANRSQMTDGARTEAADFFGGGSLLWLTGANAGFSQDVKEYLANGSTTFQLPFYYDIQIGDTYTMVAGCRFRFIQDCKTKNRNGNNFRGYPHTPGFDYLMSGKLGG